ncbi:MAG: 16S rRNA (cytosine(1402)-N(4))-methyltransferase RsmH [Clostridia bacterium]|nr:16S rRNA (cytosine(1402)-N(4))-methyltransferase RsmH [Clostridia bacterium]
MENKFEHYSVMLSECIDGLNIKPDGLYVDCTAGGGGHSFEIARHLSDKGRLIAIDRDSEAISAVTKRLSPFSDRVEIVNDNFSNLKEILNGRKADGVLIDLGVSSYQLDTASRGFSYINDAPLDMRMNQSDTVSARDVVNSYSEFQLADIIFKYGEEKFSRKIASYIVKYRETKPIETTLELANIIASAIPPKTREKGSNPAKRTFQAIRIEVNHELDIIAPTVKDIADILNPNGRMAIITFHSLEDRLVKQTIGELSKGCSCPPEFPICVCGKKPILEQITRKPILPSEGELQENKRSHSAKLRIAEKI